VTPDGAVLKFAVAAEIVTLKLELENPVAVMDPASFDPVS
jgi:hypothetical protein